MTNNQRDILYTVAPVAVAVGVVGGALWLGALFVDYVNAHNATLPRYEVNTEVYQQAFHACLERLPAGPSSTTYNDWDEVLDGCAKHARFVATVCVKNCD